MIKEEDLQNIGIFAKPHGVKGEISLITDDDLTGMTGNDFIVCSIDGICVPFFLESVRPKSASNTLVKFENLDSEDKVKFLTGKTALVPSGLLPHADERPFREKSLIGYTVVDDRFRLKGVVSDVDDSTPNVLLRVDWGGNNILVPLALVTSIQHDLQTMNASLPDGFLELFTHST